MVAPVAFEQSPESLLNAAARPDAIEFEVEYRTSPLKQTKLEWATRRRAIRGRSSSWPGWAMWLIQRQFRLVLRAVVRHTRTAQPNENRVGWAARPTLCSEKPPASLLQNISLLASLKDPFSLGQYGNQRETLYRNPALRTSSVSLLGLSQPVPYPRTSLFRKH